MVRFTDSTSFQARHVLLIQTKSKIKVRQTLYAEVKYKKLPIAHITNRYTAKCKQRIVVVLLHGDAELMIGADRHRTASLIVMVPPYAYRWIAFQHGAHQLHFHALIDDRLW